MGLDYGDLFESWEVGLTRKLVREFKAKYKDLQKESTEDLIQDCLTHWYYNRKKFDPAKKVPKKTFMGKVVSIRLLEIVREYRTDKRKVLPSSSSLSDSEDSEPKASYDPRSFFSRMELIADIKKAYTKLTVRQQAICRLIGEEGLNPTEVSKKLRVHRSTVYDELERIRKVFAEEGLDKYLK